MIENEVKFVLTPDLFKRIMDYPRLARTVPTGIRQMYHQGGGRFRDQNGVYTFNYKIDLPNGELEEFEIEIDEASFNRVVPTCKSTTHKIRYSFDFHDDHWDIDMFYGEDMEFYFCMAECEMKPGKMLPKKMPRCVRENLLLIVPRDESSDFSSKKLGDPEYARKVME